MKVAAVGRVDGTVMWCSLAQSSGYKKKGGI